MFFTDVDYQKLIHVPKKQAIDMLLNLVRENPGISNKELADKLSKSLSQVKRYLKKLCEGGILTSELSYNSFVQNGELKILTIRKLTCNTKKSNQ